MPEAGFRLGPRGFRRTIGAVARKAPIPGVGSGRILLGSGGGVEIPTTARFLRRFTARRLRDGGRTVRRQVSDPVLHVLGVVRLRQVGDALPGVLRLVAVLERGPFRGGPSAEGGFLGSVGGGFEVVVPVLVEITEDRGGLGGFLRGVGRAERVVPRTQERRPFGAWILGFVGMGGAARSTGGGPGRPLGDPIRILRACVMRRGLARVFG